MFCIFRVFKISKSFWFELKWKIKSFKVSKFDREKLKKKILKDFFVNCYDSISTITSNLDPFWEFWYCINMPYTCKHIFDMMLACLQTQWFITVKTFFQTSNITLACLQKCCKMSSIMIKEYIHFGMNIPSNRGAIVNMLFQHDVTMCINLIIKFSSVCVCVCL